MSLCVVCSSLASVFCTQDKAFLCSGCDRSIHSANVLSRRHHRLPVCELCKRNGATVYCHEDAAALCAVCDAEVHSANPLPHTTIHIDAALVQGLAKVTELPSESGCCAQSGGAGGAAAGGAATRPNSTSQQQQGPALHPSAAPTAAPTMAPQQQQQPQLPQAATANPFLSQGQPAPAGAALQEPLVHHAAADDEVSACGEHNAVGGGHHHHQKRQTDAGASAHHSPSEGNTSLAVVPDMGAQGGGAASAFPTMGLPSQDAINAKAPWATAFDALDFESAWFGNLDGGFDLSDLLGNDMAGLIDDAPGMVPSFPAATAAAPSSAAGNSNAAAAQLLVPTAAPSTATGGMFDMGVPTNNANNAANGAGPATSHQAQPSDSQALPPNLLLDDDFVVPSFLPEDDAAGAASLHDHHHFGAAPQQHHHHRGPHSGAQLPLPGMGVGGAEEDEGDAEHLAARAVAVPSFDLAQQQQQLGGSGASSAYGTRGTTNKRGAAVGVEELQRGQQQPQQQQGGRLAAGNKKSSVPPPPPMSGAALLALNGANLTREQRVARYREKRKNRKFHKTIRYASRKAYAEVRPRIKGRFATKEEVEAWKAKKAAGEAIAPEDELIF